MSRTGQSTNYRADIDGLRGIAVLAVVVYHAFPYRLTGGFIGVDVFFVISGFLITGIILDDLARAQFSFADFYARRVRRIFPALLVVLAFAPALAWVISPPEAAALGKHIDGGAGFYSNFAFWSEGGYFDNTAADKPLVHLWSLGVEEQFYILWPPLLVLLFKRRWRFVAVVLAIAIASFTLNVSRVVGDPVGTFFSPLTRFWELMIGGLLAHLSRQRTDALPLPSSATALGGLVLIAASALMINKHDPFPGALALMPTAGAFLVIGSGPGAWINRRLLATRALTGAGLISYPLYLWHWPVLYTLEQFVIPGVPMGPRRGVLRLGAIAIAFVLAWLTYRFIEKPIRFGPRRARATRPLVLAMVAVFAVGLWMYDTDGLAFRVSPSNAALLKPPRGVKFGYRTGVCFLDRTDGPELFSNCTVGAKHPTERVFLWGDSHAADLYPGYRRTLGANASLTEMTAAGCPPIPAHAVYYFRNCERYNEFVLQTIAKTEPDRVIMSANWSSYDWMLLVRTIHRLKAMGISSIEIIGPTPRWRRPFPELLYYEMKARHTDIPPARMTSGLVPGDGALDDSLRAFAAMERVRYRSPFEILCAVDGCLTVVGGGPQVVVTWDENHLTAAGSVFLVSRFK